MGGSPSLGRLWVLGLCSASCGQSLSRSSEGLQLLQAPSSPERDRDLPGGTIPAGIRAREVAAPSPLGPVRAPSFPRTPEPGFSRARKGFSSQKLPLAVGKALGKPRVILRRLSPAPDGLGGLRGVKKGGRVPLGACPCLDRDKSLRERGQGRAFVRVALGTFPGQLLGDTDCAPGDPPLHPGLPPAPQKWLFQLFPPRFCDAGAAGSVLPLFPGSSKPP